MLVPRDRSLWITAAAVALAGAAVAVGAPPELRTFGPAGQGDGNLGARPAAIAVAADGTLYVADRQQDRIEVFANDGTPSSAWGGVDEPTAIALDGDRLLVGDSQGVRAFAPDGTQLEDLGGPVSPGGIAVAPDGAVHATDTAGAVVDLSGGGSLGEGDLTMPAGLAFGEQGDFYVADPGDGTVKHFSAEGGLLHDWPAAGPAGVAVGPDGTVYVAEEDEQRVGHFGAGGQRIDDIGGEGVLNAPRAVALDCRGAVYVLDNSNPRGHVFADHGTPAPPCPPPPDDPPPDDPPPDDPPPRDPPADDPPPEAAPEVGRTTRATVLSGVVFVGRGAARRALTGREMLPIGELVDTAQGAVMLEFEAIGPDRERYGPLMDADFEGGRFTTHQAQGDSLVEIALAGRAAAATRSGRARAARKKSRRRVWTRARGRFRSRGNHGAATVRGTRWLTEERRRGTYFEVTEGSIAVEEFARGRTRVLDAPESYVARAPCVSRRRFRIRLRPPAGTVVRGVSLRMDGQRLRVRRGRRLTALVDLRGRPRGRVVLRISVRTQDGRVIRGTRDYHPCSPRARRDGVPKL